MLSPDTDFSLPSPSLLDYVPYDDGGTLFVIFCFLVRTLLAVACTASATASFSIMVNTFPDNVATVFGLLETSSGVGLMIGPALGGVLYEVGNFVMKFVVNVDNNEADYMQTS